MNPMYEQDGLSSIEMVELGVRPFDWIDDNKEINDPMNDYFGKEKTIDFTVYSAQLQLINNESKITTNGEDASMSDDDDSNDYEIDPETGEKNFREATLASNTSLSSPNDKWIEEYLSNIESSSNQILPNTTTTTDNSEFIFDNIPFSLLENTDEPTDWLSSIINLDENSDSIMFADPIISNQFINDNETKSDQITTASSSPIFVSLSNENNNNQTRLHNHLSTSIDDEYSTSSTSSSNGSRQNRLYSSLESDSQMTFVEAKLEKIDPDENPTTHMMVRRASTRSSYQTQYDEDALRRFNIPLTLTDITQSSTEDYNRHLARLSHLSAEQMHIVKDIRRRGKNKVAAQNCRKRKAISVESLLEEVDELKRVKHELEERKRVFEQQIAETRSQYEYLHRQVLPDRQLPPAILVK